MVKNRLREEYVNLLKEAYDICFSLEGVQGDTAYVILSNDNQKMNDEMIEVIPELMDKWHYEKVVLVCDKTVLENRYECKSIDSEILHYIVVLQRAFHPFRNIYVNYSEGYDDNDFTCFINEKDVDLKYIIRNVFFDLSNTSKRKTSNIVNKKKWNEIYEKIMMYASAYDNIRDRFPEGKLFIHPFASGDMYVSCLYLKDYVDDKGIEDYKVLVSNKGAQRVGKLFGIDSHMVAKEKLIQAVYFQRIFGEEMANIKNTHMCVGSQRGAIFIPIIDYNTHEQKWVYQAAKRKDSPELLQKNSNYVFDKYNLVPERTIIISPFSQSVCPVEEDYYSDIINNLLDRGYQVCTNISNEEDRLPGTIGVYLPYDIVIDFVNKSVGFIGMRSGLCDVISSTISKMIVFHRESHFEQFSLKKMGLKTDNILELCVDRLDRRFVTTSTVNFLTKDK